eukprot:CAMPEP_0178419042 /NCGR_PEP_ID=MMETSP0689_2-20121128/25401_1 /TAXON_ID=160604 /ORGANISM="Amphidinium massartii, Strain CS-259" /LENGTH=252 /DNA_ID=CAMNT_0020040457 /DNA_START=168 /DNA_END=922 /DNA_ORIENTATION=-
MGQYVQVTYKESMQSTKYEGTLCDKRIGSTERESYIELKDCRKIEREMAVSNEGTKRFIDSFIEECVVTEPSPEAPPQPQGGMMMGGAAGMPGMMPMMGMPMMPMMGMGMMPGMMPMGMMPMGMQAAGSQPGAGNDSAASSSKGAGVTPPASSSDVAGAIAAIDVGQYVKVAYVHPSLGKTTYVGILTEKRPGASHEAFVELEYCKRLGRKGNVRERFTEKKRLMTAFIDGIEVTEPVPDLSRSPSRGKKSR